jgi:hypothetical protein
VSRKPLTVNEEVAHKRIINCANAVKLRNIRKYMYKIIHKWENKINNIKLKIGKGSRFIVIRINMEKKGIVPLEIVICVKSCGQRKPSVTRTQSSV